MAKKTIFSEAQETMVAAAKTGMAVAKLAATAGLAAAGPAAAGVVLESVSQGLQRAEQKAENLTPREGVERVGVKPSAGGKKTTTRKSPAKQKKRTPVKAARAGNRPAPKKKKKTSKKSATRKTVKRKAGKSQRKR